MTKLGFSDTLFYCLDWLSDVVLLFCMPRGHTKAGIPTYRLLCLMRDNPCPQGSVIKIGRTNKWNKVTAFIPCTDGNKTPKRLSGLPEATLKSHANAKGKNKHILCILMPRFVSRTYDSLFPEASREIPVKTSLLYSYSCIPPCYGTYGCFISFSKWARALPKGTGRRC